MCEALLTSTGNTCNIGFPGPKNIIFFFCLNKSPYLQLRHFSCSVFFINKYILVLTPKKKHNTSELKRKVGLLHFFSVAIKYLHMLVHNFLRVYFKLRNKQFNISSNC